jgi:REP element-mobilizing transposase RayT
MPAFPEKYIMPSAQHKEWYSRGYLPHFDHPALLQAITFHLADSLPTEVLFRLKERAQLQKDPDLELRQQIQKYLDAGHGSCVFKDARLARMVEYALFHFDGERYRLLAWVIMPNHIHVLIETISGYPLHKVVHSWKSFTAQKANKHLKQKGEFWQREYFDRFVRNEEHFNAVVRYIHI